MLDMTERPILFSGPMVRALLDGRKTQTRRIVKPQPPAHLHLQPMFGWNAHDQKAVGTPGLWRVAGPDYPDCASDDRRCPYGVPGDTLWVRESWALHERFTDVGRVVYAATANRSWTEAHQDFPIGLIGDRKARPFQEGFKPSIHMPRWASRLTLTVTDVRAERLQDCSERDAIAEGLQVKGQGFMPSYRGADNLPWRPEFPRDAYADLWDKINGKGSWAANPWVWAVSFDVQARP